MTAQRQSLQTVGSQRGVAKPSTVEVATTVGRRGRSWPFHGGLAALALVAAITVSACTNSGDGSDAGATTQTPAGNLEAAPPDGASAADATFRFATCLRGAGLDVQIHGDGGDRLRAEPAPFIAVPYSPGDTRASVTETGGVVQTGFVGGDYSALNMDYVLFTGTDQVSDDLRDGDIVRGFVTVSSSQAFADADPELYEIYSSCEQTVPEFRQPEPISAAQDEAQRALDIAATVAFAQCARAQGYQQIADPGPVNAGVDLPQEISGAALRELFTACVDPEAHGQIITWEGCFPDNVRWAVQDEFPGVFGGSAGAGDAPACTRAP